jgi:hypothetical protein
MILVGGVLDEKFTIDSRSYLIICGVTWFPCKSKFVFSAHCHYNVYLNKGYIAESYSTSLMIKHKDTSIFTENKWCSLNYGSSNYLSCPRPSVGGGMPPQP